MRVGSECALPSGRALGVVVVVGDALVAVAVVVEAVAVAVVAAPSTNSYAQSASEQQKRQSEFFSQRLA